MIRGEGKRTVAKETRWMRVEVNRYMVGGW